MIQKRLSDFALILLIVIAGILLSNAAKTTTDFTPRYVGAQAALAGLSPYSLEATQRIQRAYYGEIVTDGRDEQRFAYPAYSLFIFAPLTAFPLTTAYTIWMTVQVALVLISMRRLGVSPLVTVLLLLALKEPIAATFLGQCVLWSAAWIGFAADALERGQERRAGLFFAFATIQPTITIPLALIVLFRHRRALASFIISMSVLALASIILWGWWIPDWVSGLTAYAGYVVYMVWMVQLFPPLAVLGLPMLGFALVQRSLWARLAVGLSALVILLPLTGIYHLSLFLPVLARIDLWARWVIGIGFWLMSPLTLEARRWETVVIALVVTIVYMLPSLRAWLRQRTQTAAVIPVTNDTP